MLCSPPENQTIEATNSGSVKKVNQSQQYKKERMLVLVTKLSRAYHIGSIQKVRMMSNMAIRVNKPKKIKIPEISYNNFPIYTKSFPLGP